MSKVHIDGDSLIVEIEGSDKLWALKSRLIIPLANVLGATADAGVINEPKGVRPRRARARRHHRRYFSHPRGAGLLGRP
jgi:hypothetical protein